MICPLPDSDSWQVSPLQAPEIPEQRNSKLGTTEHPYTTRRSEVLRGKQDSPLFSDDRSPHFLLESGKPICDVAVSSIDTNPVFCIEPPQLTVCPIPSFYDDRRTPPPARVNDTLQPPRRRSPKWSQKRHRHRTVYPIYRHLFIVTLANVVSVAVSLSSIPSSPTPRIISTIPCVW